MATYPSPFPYTFSSYPVPPSVFFPTPAYGSPSVPSATTYHQPPFAPPPFPYAANNHQPFPYVATYSYPSPPASAYTPVSDCSTNWPTWPPPAPGPAPSTAPSTFPSTTTSSPLNFPVELGNNFSPSSSSDSPFQQPTIPTNHTSVHLPNPAAPPPDAAPSTPHRELRPPKCHTSSKTSSHQAISFPYSQVHKPPPESTVSHAPAPPTTGTRANSVKQPTALPHRPGSMLAALDGLASQVELFRRSLLDINRRVDEYLAHSQRSSASLQGELSKQLSSSVSSTATTPTPSVGLAPSHGSTALAASAPAMFCATSSMTATSATPMSVTTVPAAPAYVAPQELGEMPKQYGFHNLNCHTVFLADGSEHSYFVLPENYPLERATPEPVFAVYDDKADGCSNEFVHVFASTPEQQPYEDEQQTSDQLLKCVRNATELTQATACLNTTSDVQVFSLELQQQDDERAYSCSDLKASVPVVTRSSQLSIEHSSMREFRLLWDPGALASHSNKGCTVIIHQQLHNKNRSSMQEFSFEKGRQSQWDPGKQTILSSVQNRDIGSVYFTTHVPLVLSASCSESTEKCLANQELTANASSKVPALTWHSSLLGTPSILSSTTYTWDPGDTELQVLFSNVASAKKLQCIDVYKSKMVQLLVGKLGASRAPIFQSAIMCPYALGLGWTEVNASANIQQLRAPALNILLLHERRKEWDPGDDCFGQPVDLKQFWVQLLLPSHSWYNTTNAFLQVHYCCWPFVLNCPYSEPVQLLVCSSCMFSSTEAIMSAMCMSTANTIHMILLLSSGERTQEGRDTTAVYHVFKTQLPMSRTSHIWDPGVQLSLYCWLNIVTEWSEMIKPLSCTNIPELATWHSQVISASYVWDPGTMLLWYRSIWSLRFTEEKEMGRLIPERGSLWFNAMHYCQIFQNCHAMSSQLYGNQDIKFTGIDLWMIHFLPP